MRYREDIETRCGARHKASIRFLGDVQGKNVLDVACWIGWVEKFVVEKGCGFVVGIDMDRRAIAKARNIIRYDRCHFVVASALALPFGPSFDSVSAFEILEHLPLGLETVALREAERVLRERGEMFISVPANNFLAKLLDPAYVLGHRHYGPDTIKALADEAHLDICEQECYGGMAQLLSLILFYAFRRVDMEFPLRSLLERLCVIEHRRPGFVTLFVRASKK